MASQIAEVVLAWLTRSKGGAPEGGRYSPAPLRSQGRL